MHKDFILGSITSKTPVNFNHGDFDTTQFKPKSFRQTLFALRGDKRIQEIVFGLRLRFGIINRDFNKDDFYSICKSEEIIVVDYEPLALNGLYCVFRGYKFIVVSSRLTGKRFLFTAYHELGHALLHNPIKQTHSFSNQPTLNSYLIEAQANYFAEITTEVKLDAK